MDEKQKSIWKRDANEVIDPLARRYVAWWLRRPRWFRVLAGWPVIILMTALIWAIMGEGWAIAWIVGVVAWFVWAILYARKARRKRSTL
jgi:hypothetical protein